jgi:heterodisulfide reductase subunit B
MEFTYYPGCSLTGSAQELDDSFRQVAAKLGVKLSEIPDWTCCGASSAHMIDAYLETALPAKDLMTAQRMGHDVVAPCAGCHVRMKAAARRLVEDRTFQAKYPFEGKIKVLSGLEMLHSEPVLSLIKDMVVRPLTGLRVVPYYGCLAVRPVDVVEPTDAENPKEMDRILEAIGADVLQWPYKTDCCGGSLSLTRTDQVMKLSRKLLDMARHVGADAIVTFCPMCHANLDTRQADISRESGQVYHTPILYVTELVGIALGIPGTAWLAKHIVPGERTLAEKGLA